MTEQEKQIREEAERLYPNQRSNGNDIYHANDMADAKQEAYIAGATAERERAKVLAIAYEKWCRGELWQHEYREQRIFTDDEKYFLFINQYNP